MPVTSCCPDAFQWVRCCNTVLCWDSHTADKAKTIADRNMPGGACRLVPQCQTVTLKARFLGWHLVADVLRQKWAFLSFGFGTRPSPVVPASTSFNPDLLRKCKSTRFLCGPLTHAEYISIHKSAHCWTAASGPWYRSASLPSFQISSTSILLPVLGR